MTTLLVLVSVLGIAVAVGLLKVKERRRLDRGHFLAFAGFNAALIATLATVANLAAAIAWFRPPNIPYLHSAQQGFLFISASLGMIASAIAFVIGFFSKGTPRIVLIAFGPLMGFVYLLAAVSNFGS